MCRGGDAFQPRMRSHRGVRAFPVLLFAESHEESVNSQELDMIEAAGT